MNNKQKIQTVIWGVVLIVMFVALFQWSAERDRKQAAWYEAYVECVKQEYNTTPWAWYAEHNEAPECDVTK